MLALPDVTGPISIDLLVAFFFLVPPSDRRGSYPPGNQEILGLTERLVGWRDFERTADALAPKGACTWDTSRGVSRLRLAGRSARREIEPGLASEWENSAAAGPMRP